MSDHPSVSIIVPIFNEEGSLKQFYNELKAAYAELWNEEAQRLFGKNYGDQLSRSQKREVRRKYPLVLSESAPTSFGE